MEIGRECVRSGWVALQPKALMDQKRLGSRALEYMEARLSYPTVCKTWRCPRCRTKRSWVVAQVARYGTLMHQPCYFTTLTFRKERGSVRDADFVQKVWRRFLKENILSEWFKVIELTKKGQPHLHLVWGPGPAMAGTRDLKGYLARGNPLHEKIEAAWKKVTGGDSYITKTAPVRGGANAARYVTKYLTKWGYWEGLEALGFGRRWSKSNGWAPGYQLELEATRNGLEWETHWSSGKATRSQIEYAEIQNGSQGAAVPVGTDLALGLRDRNDRERRVKETEWVRSFFNGT